MIIKLPTADFSAVNIGVVDFRTDVNATTQALLDVFGKTTWTLAQKLAIEDFKTAFDSASWKAKVKYMFMPILAPVEGLVDGGVDPTKNKVGYDIANGVFVKSVLKTNDGLCSNGVNGITRTGISDVSWLYAFYYQLTNVFTVADGGHIGLYYRMGVNTGGASNNYVMQPTGAYLQFKETSYRNGNASQITATYDTNKKNLKGFRLISYDNAGDVTAINDSVAIPTVTGTTTDFEITGTDVKFNIGSDTAGNTCEDLEMAFLTFGDYLTNAESLEYSALVEALMSALWTE